jgi:hypothetical protein
MKLNSKWSYIMVGVNAMVAAFGAMLHNVLLLMLGVMFTVWNFYVAEHTRRLEDESIRKSENKD